MLFSTVGPVFLELEVEFFRTRIDRGRPQGRDSALLRAELINNDWRIATGMPENPPRSHACSSPRKSSDAIASAIAALLLLGGFSAPAWATYGGGACHSCTPAPVIATQCDVVSLAPRVETVYQTVYETVYVNEPVTVMETRYRHGLQDGKLHRHEAGHRDVVRRAALHGHEAGLPDGQPRATLHGHRSRSTRPSTASAATR